MGLLRAHVTAVAVVLIAVAATGGVFAFARPAYHADTLPDPPTDVPYTHVAYHAAETQIAFARHGVHVALRSQLPYATDLSTEDMRIEVTVFGAPDAVRRQGSVDYVLDAQNHWVHYPRTCLPGTRKAAMWRENVRVIVSCGPDDVTLLRRAASALAAL